jgi:5-methylthioadenosine/S-adenosylhomocysteine deaminase
MDAASTLRMATLGGATAIGMGERIGSVVPGKRADLICVDMDRIETQPLYDPISQLVYATGRQHVTDVWVDGHAKLCDGQLTGVDMVSLIANARQWRGRIAAIGSAR